MQFVQMFHPETGGTGKVPQSAVQHHLSLGWVVDPPPETEDLTEPIQQEEF